MSTTGGGRLSDETFMLIEILIYFELDHPQESTKDIARQPIK